MTATETKIEHGTTRRLRSALWVYGEGRLGWGPLQLKPGTPVRVDNSFVRKSDGQRQYLIEFGAYTGFCDGEELEI